MRSKRWVVFALLFAARTTIAFQFQSVPAVGPLALEGFISDYATLGVLTGIYMLPGVVLAFPGGLLDRGFGAKRVLILGLALMVIGGAVMASHERAHLFAGRLISGSGAAFLNVVLARAVSSWFDDRELTLVMGVFVASWPLGIALALVALPSVMLSGGWPTVTIISILPPLLCLFLLAFWYQDHPGAQPIRSGGLKPELSRRSLALATVAGTVWGLYNVTYVVVVASLPDLLVSRGLSATQASAITSVLGWVLMISLPLGGYAAERIARPALSMAACFIVIAASAVGIAAPEGMFVSLVVLAVSFGLPAGLIMATAARILPPSHRPAGMGIYFTVFYCVMAILPGVAGLIREVSDRPESPVYLAALTSTGGLVAVLVLTLMQRRSPGLSR